MKILLIDDDLDSLEALHDALTPTGYYCDKFTSSKEALERFSQQNYDVVITDVRMPSIDGIQVLRSIRKLCATAKVIIITAFASVDVAIAAVNNGAYAFLCKPVDVGELLENLEKISEQEKKEEENRREYERLTHEFLRLKETYDEMQLMMNPTTHDKDR